MNIYEISLSEFALRCERMGMYPLDIIYEYLVQTKQEIQGLDMITKLARSKADRIQSQLNYARSWIPVKVDVYKANKNVTRQQAEIIDRLTDYYCLGMDIPEQYLAMCIMEDGEIHARNTYWKLPKEKGIVIFERGEEKNND